MEKLQELELVDVINKYCKSGKPVLGICLGMQLFCSRSHEFGDFKGLNLIPRIVKNISSIKQFKNKIKVPVIGWHEVKNSKKNSITVNLKNNSFYHIHSFYCDLAEKKYELFETNISGIPVCTGLNKDNIYGFQFHPEKSRGQGIELLNQFCNIS